jgi:hypothetical protein
MAHAAQVKRGFKSKAVVRPESAERAASMPNLQGAEVGSEHVECLLVEGGLHGTTILFPSDRGFLIPERGEFGGIPVPLRGCGRRDLLHR